jgi:hypothetical protein
LFYWTQIEYQRHAQTPSYLKGLAETRARAARAAQRFDEIYEEIGQKLAKAERALAACDCLIQKFDERLNPGLIQPIHGWKGRYGKRGPLLEEVKRIVQNAWPEKVTTTEIVWRAQMRFQLHFLTFQEKKRWQDNSLRNAIKNLLAKGEIERMHDKPVGLNAEVGRSRWKSDAFLSLDHLHAQAEDAGVSVQLAMLTMSEVLPKRGFSHV